MLQLLRIHHPAIGRIHVHWTPKRHEVRRIVKIEAKMEKVSYMLGIGSRQLQARVMNGDVNIYMPAQAQRRRPVAAQKIFSSRRRFYIVPRNTDTIGDGIDIMLDKVGSSND
jgi:hypothetical protein